LKKVSISTYSINGLKKVLNLDRATLTKAMTGVPADRTTGHGGEWLISTAVRALGMRSGSGRRVVGSTPFEALGVVEATAKLKSIQAERERLKLSISRGETIKTELACKAVEKVLMNVRTRIMEIPVKTAPRLKVLKTEQEIKSKLESAVLEALNDVSKFDANRIFGELAGSCGEVKPNASEYEGSDETDGK